MATDEAAAEHLRSRGIKTLPVTIVDGDEVVIGYDPKKLVALLNLYVSVDLSGKAAWLAEKYDVILGAAVRVARQLSQSQVEQQVPWRALGLGDTILHVLSFPELAWRSHMEGGMSDEDMRASDERLRDEIVTTEAIAQYGEGVRKNITDFLRDESQSTAEAFDLVVPANYGGEVTVLELLNISLSHSTHHLKQVYWHLESDLGIVLQNPATDEEMKGIATPTGLI